MAAVAMEIFETHQGSHILQVSVFLRQQKHLREFYIFLLQMVKLDISPKEYCLGSMAIYIRKPKIRESMNRCLKIAVLPL